MAWLTDRQLGTESPTKGIAMLIDEVRDKCKVLGYSPKTFKTYWQHIESFLRHERNLCGEWVHPSKLGSEEIERYLTHLAVKQQVSPNTQNLALQAA